MRVSEHFKLNLSQPELEFVDVDTRDDTPLFIDPRAVLSIGSAWSERCVALLQSFFDSVILALKSEDYVAAKRLLQALGEPNETRLGLSTAKAQGRGMGPELADEVWKALSTSEAVSSGLLEDLEDTILFVPGIGHDIISDITTNIIRRELIEFTQDVCKYYQIPLTPDVVSGRLWNPQANGWEDMFVELPTTDQGRLLLVPKSIVRRNPTFDPNDYYNNYILPQLQEDELRDPSSNLVYVLKSGERRVTKKSVREKYGGGKRVNLKTTLDHPYILTKYRKDRTSRARPLGHPELAEATDTATPNWDRLLTTVLAVEPGRQGADAYHRAVSALFNALFYPALDFGTREFAIHEGRKRIDINYTNVADSGFFYWVNTVHQTPAAFLAVECKNYGAEIGNPEIDQLLGRFSDRRTRLGLLVHRGFGDKQRIVRRCHDAASDGNGYVIALDDEDLTALVAERSESDSLEFPLLHQRFGELL